MARLSKKSFVQFNMLLDAYRYYVARSATSQPKKLAPLANLTTKRNRRVYGKHTPTALGALAAK